MVVLSFTGLDPQQSCTVLGEIESLLRYIKTAHVSRVGGLILVEPHNVRTYAVLPAHRIRCGTGYEKTQLFNHTGWSNWMVIPHVRERGERGAVLQYDRAAELRLPSFVFCHSALAVDLRRRMTRPPSEAALPQRRRHASQI